MNAHFKVILAVILLGGALGVVVYDVDNLMGPRGAEEESDALEGVTFDELDEEEDYVHGDAYPHEEDPDAYDEDLEDDEEGDSLAHGDPFSTGLPPALETLFRENMNTRNVRGEIPSTSPLGSEWNDSVWKDFLDAYLARSGKEEMNVFRTEGIERDSGLETSEPAREIPPLPVILPVQAGAVKTDFGRSVQALALQGILHGPRGASVLLNGRIYRVGDRVNPLDATLSAIERNRVVLEALDTGEVGICWLSARGAVPIRRAVGGEESEVEDDPEGIDEEPREDEDEVDPGTVIQEISGM